MFGERALKTPLYGLEYIPPDIEITDKAVCAVDFYDRNVIILRYQRHLSFRELARKLEVKIWRVGKILNAAEAAIHHERKRIEDGLSSQSIHC